MSITSIRRDWGDNVSIVRIISNDSLATVGSANYITNQHANIVAANNGAFTWLTNDEVLVSASNGNQFFTINSTFTSLLPQGAQRLEVAFTAAQFDAMYTTPILLIPAQGANSLIIVTSMQLLMTYGSAPFAAGGSVFAAYADSNALATNQEQASDFYQTSSTVFNFISDTGNGSYLPLATSQNEGVFLTNATEDFTGGTGSTFIAKLTYNVITTNS